MMEFVVLTYGVFASFIMSSISRNRREARQPPAMLSLFGWAMMAFSLTGAILILCAIVYRQLSVGPLA